MPCARCNAPMPPGPFRLHCKRCAPARGRLSLAPPKPQSPDPVKSWGAGGSSGNWDFAIDRKPQAGTKELNGLEGVYIHIRHEDRPAPAWQIWLTCRCGGEACHEIPANATAKKLPKVAEWLPTAPACPNCSKKLWGQGREIFLILPLTRPPS